MSAQNLITLAAAKGYSIGRRKPGLYYYGRNGIEQTFAGSWSEFVKLIQAL
jgi:hypothetical protein